MGKSKFIVSLRLQYNNMDGYSQTPQQGRIKALQSIMPEVFDEGKMDWEKLKATLGDEVNFANERYVLNWAGKSDAFRISPLRPHWSLAGRSLSISTKPKTSSLKARTWKC